MSLDQPVIATVMKFGAPDSQNLLLQMEKQTILAMIKFFQKWCNYIFLKNNAGIKLIDITEQIKSGVILCQLVEYLTNEKILNFNSDPSTEEEKLKNINLAIDHVKEIGSTNIGLANAQDLYSGNKKIIANFFWHVFLRFELSTTKSELLKWSIDNIAYSGIVCRSFVDAAWTNGKGFHALISKFAKETKEELNTAVNLASVELLAKVFECAQKEFQIPILLDYSDFDSIHSEKLVITYLSFIYERCGPPSELRRLRVKTVELKNEQVFQINEIKTDFEERLRFAEERARIAEAKMEESEYYAKKAAKELEYLIEANKKAQGDLAAQEHKSNLMSKTLTEMSLKMPFLISSNPSTSGELPSKGSFFIVSTSIPKSDSIWESSPHAMAAALRQHNSMILAFADLYKGKVVLIDGGSFLVVFLTAVTAVKFCTKVQEALASTSWQSELTKNEHCVIEQVDGKNIFAGLRVAMTMHYGEPILQSDPATGRGMYVGSEMNIVKTIHNLVSPGQIVLTPHAWSVIQNTLVTEISDDEKELEKAAYDVRMLEKLGAENDDEPGSLMQILPIDLAARQFPEIKASETNIPQDACAMLESEMNSLQKQNDYLCDQLQNMSLQLAEAMTRAAELQKMLAERLQGSDVDLKEKLEQSQEQIEYLLNQLNETQSKLIAANQSQDKQTEYLQSLAQQLTQLSTNYQFVELKYNQLLEEFEKIKPIPQAALPQFEQKKKKSILTMLGLSKNAKQTTQTKFGVKAETPPPNSSPNINVVSNNSQIVTTNNLHAKTAPPTTSIPNENQPTLIASMSGENIAQLSKNKKKDKLKDAKK
eukprot:TRINITY_DN3002_c0_g1_i1.p1 TRINITY_DN3002_c0_g1~~TRINITY_DN3002_c0_g1_i1.p1  ORF type:complete len:822 (-),score=415.41 TRINITY_DN3002_c0_g1_i1:104-2569(-)